MRPTAHAALGAALLLTATFRSALAAPPCAAVQFPSGTTSAVLHATAPKDSAICYAVTTNAGEHAELRILSGINTVFGIDGLTDIETEYGFTTAHETYKIRVFQLMRTATSRPFALRISIK